MTLSSLCIVSEATLNGSNIQRRYTQHSTSTTSRSLDFLHTCRYALADTRVMGCNNPDIFFLRELPRTIDGVESRLGIRVHPTF
ncbi:hypothetical protein M3J09_000813 [Ascochyta lentis]